VIRRPGRSPGLAAATVLLALATAPANPAAAQADAPPPLPFLLPDSIAWRESGPGMAFATVAGDPAAEGASYGLLAKLQDGAWIPPHWHPRDKHIQVLSGVLLIGLGAAQDTAAARALPAGGVTTVPAEMVHYEGARGETIVLFFGDGPLRTRFVDAGG
jgi:hypothetical protein